MFCGGSWANAIYNITHKGINHKTHVIVTVYGVEFRDWEQIS